MKRFFAIIITVLLISALIFCIHSCTKDSYKINDQKNNESSVPDLYVPTDDSNVKNDESSPNTNKEDSTVYTGVGIYHGKVDSNSIEITLDGTQPLLISARISPELAKNFSSLKLQEESIISFEYQLVNDMYVIQKIIK